MGAHCYCAPVPGTHSRRWAVGRRRRPFESGELIVGRPAPFFGRVTWLTRSRSFLEICGLDRLKFCSSSTMDRPSCNLWLRFARAFTSSLCAWIVGRPSQDQWPTIARPFARVRSNASRWIQRGPSDARSSAHNRPRRFQILEFPDGIIYELEKVINFTNA